MRSKSLFAALVIAILVVPLLTACGPQSIDVTLQTYKLTMSKQDANSGKIVFHVTNKAVDQKHEFVIFKTDLPEDKMPVDENGDVNEDDPQVQHIDEVEVEPGESKDLAVELQPGNYVMICNVSENHHYMQGMHQAFVVH